MGGIAELVVRLGSYIVKLSFIVCERLAAPLILGCDYMDRYVEAIKPRQKLVEMEDGSTVPITRRPLKTTKFLAPQPLPEEFGKTHGRVSTKIKVARAVNLPPESQTWVTVQCDRHGLHVIQPDSDLYNRRAIIASNGIVQVEPERPFHILVANFAKYEQRLHKNQCIGTVLPHPTAVLPTHVHLADVLGVTEEVGVVQTPPDPPNPSTKDGASPTLEDIGLSHLPLGLQKRIRAMLRPFSSMWDGSLGEIRTTEHRIDLQPNKRPISHPLTGLVQRCALRSKRKLIACCEPE